VLDPQAAATPILIVNPDKLSLVQIKCHVSRGSRGPTTASVTRQLTDLDQVTGNPPYGMRDPYIEEKRVLLSTRPSTSASRDLVFPRCGWKVAKR